MNIADEFGVLVEDETIAQTVSLDEVVISSTRIEPKEEKNNLWVVIVGFFALFLLSNKGRRKYKRRRKRARFSY